MYLALRDAFRPGTYSLGETSTGNYASLNQSMGLFYTSDLFLNKKSVVFQVVFDTRNGGCSKNPRIQAWPNQKDHSGIIIG